VTNTNALLGHNGFVGMKTGSDEAAGGCVMFRASGTPRAADER
jgi:D-alanyl-D-alanine carboxypeptidase (penicillin-binding protein 5/6)